MIPIIGNGMQQEELEEICSKILNVDSKIRFVEITLNGMNTAKTRQGLERFLDFSETKKSIDDSIARWETRKKLAPKLGDPLYAFAEYGKVKRITIPINNNGLILVSMDSAAYHELIIREIMEIKAQMNFNIPDELQEMTQEGLIHHLHERFGLSITKASVIYFIVEKHFTKQNKIISTNKTQNFKLKFP